MSIVKTIGRGVAWSTAATIIGKCVVMLNLFLILQYLSVYAYGLSELVLSVVSMISILLLPGLAASIVADMGVERERGDMNKMKSLFVQFFTMNLAFGIIAWAILFFGSDIAARLAGNETIGYLLKIVSFLFLTSPFRSVTTLLAAVELRYFDQSFFGIVEEIAKLACICFFFFVVDFGLSGLLWSMVLAQLIAIVVYVPRSFSAYRIFGGAHVNSLTNFWHVLGDHRKWSIASTYVGTLGQSLQLWLIKFFLGTEAVGLYSFAYGIFSQVGSFLPLTTVLAPLLPRYVDMPKEFARYVRSSIKAQLLFAVPLIALTLVGLPALIYVFPKYAPVVPIIVVMIFTLIPNSVITVYNPAFNALKRQFDTFVSVLWKIVFIVIVTPCSIFLFDLAGIGLSVVIFSMLSAVERTIRLRKGFPEFSLQIRDFFTFDPYEVMLVREVVGRWRASLDSAIKRK